MRCDQAQELITARIDNELDGAEQSAIDAHLQDCPACRSALAAETRLKKQINEAQRSIVAPDSLRRQIENEFAARRPVAANRFGGGVSSWFKLPSWRPAFALALLVVSIVTFYYRSETPPGVSVAALSR